MVTHLGLNLERLKGHQIVDWSLFGEDDKERKGEAIKCSLAFFYFWKYLFFTFIPVPFHIFLNSATSFHVKSCVRFTSQ